MATRRRVTASPTTRPTSSAVSLNLVSVRPDCIERQYEDRGGTAQRPGRGDSYRSNCRAIRNPGGVADGGDDDEHRDGNDWQPARARQRARHDCSATHRIGRPEAEQHRCNRYSGHYRGWIEAYWTPMKEIFATGTISQRTKDRVKIDRQERIKTGRFRRSISNQD